MDFSALTNSTQIGRIDQISVSFFKKYAFQTNDKISELGRRRLIDNLFYSLANCSHKVTLLDLTKNITFSGDIEQLSDKFAELIGGHKGALEDITLDIAFDEHSFMPGSINKLKQSYPFLSSVWSNQPSKQLQNTFLQNLSALCEEYKQMTNRVQKKDSQNFTFEDYLRTLDNDKDNNPKNYQFKELFDKLSCEVTTFKNKLTKFFQINSNQPLEEVSKAIENKLNSFYQNLENLSNEIRTFSKKPSFGKLKVELDTMQNALKAIKIEVYNPSSTQKSNPDIEHTAIHFEDKNKSPSGETDVPFFSFYRVKSVAKHKKILKGSRKSNRNLGLKDLKTSEYGFSELGSSDSISYHICDQEGMTLSQVDEFSDDYSGRLHQRSKLRVNIEEKSLKKNQSANQIISHESCEDKFAKTINFDDISKAKKISQESIVLGLPDNNLQNLKTENALLKGNLELLGVNIDSFIDKSNEYWKVTNEKSLDEVMNQFVTLQEHLKLSNSSIPPPRPQAKNEHIDISQPQKLIRCNVESSALNLLKLKYESSLQSIQKISQTLSKSEERQAQLGSSFKKITSLLASHSNEERKNQTKNAHLSKLKTLLKSKIVGLKANLDAFKYILEDTKYFSIAVSLMRTQLVNQKANADEIKSNKALLLHTNQNLQAVTNSHSVSLDELRRCKFQTKTAIGKFQTLTQKIDKFASLIKQNEVDYETKLPRVIQKFQLYDNSWKETQKQANKKVSDAQMDSTNLQYINTNLLKELQILSTNQQRITREKEALEEQIKQKEELDEKNKEMSLTIKLLQEKLEMSNSLRDMAEQKFQSLEENESRFDKYGKSNQDIYTNEYNFNRHLGTIDENEELIEISETQEQNPVLKDQYGANPGDEKFKSQDNLAIKLQKRVITKSYSLKFTRYIPQDSNMIIDEQEKIEKIFEQNEKILPFMRESKNLKNSGVRENEQGFDSTPDNQYLDDNEPDIPFKLRQNKSGLEESKKHHDRIVNGPDKRSSGKKSLFSMENVLKSIGDVNKADLRPAFPKPIAEFNTNEEMRQYSNQNKQPWSATKTRGDERELVQKSLHIKSKIDKLVDAKIPFPSPKSTDPFVKHSSDYQNPVSIKYITDILKKVTSLNLLVNSQNKQFESKLTCVKEKLVNIELLQNIQVDLINDFKDPSQHSQQFLSPQEGVNMSLTDRMKLMQDNKDYNAPDTKLFSKHSSQSNAPNFNSTNPKSKESFEAKTSNNNAKFTQLRKNYGNTSVKNNSHSNASDQMKSSDNKSKANPQTLVQKIEVKNKIKGHNLQGLNKPPLKSKTVQVIPSAEFSPSVENLEKPNKNIYHKNFLSKLQAPNKKTDLLPPSITQLENPKGPMDVNNSRSKISESSQNLNITEFELVDKEQLKSLIDFKENTERIIEDNLQKHLIEKQSILNELSHLKSANDSLKIESIKLLGDNEYLSDANTEYQNILERAFDLAKGLAEDDIENDVMMKPEYIDKILEIIKIKFANYQTMVQAMDEEINMLKNELFPSDENYRTEVDMAVESNDNPSFKNRRTLPDDKKNKHSINQQKQSNIKEPKRRLSQSKSLQKAYNSQDIDTRNIQNYRSSDEILIQNNYSESLTRRDYVENDLKVSTSQPRVNPHQSDQTNIRQPNKISEEYHDEQIYGHQDNFVNPKDELKFKMPPLRNEQAIIEEEFEDQNMTSFSHKQKILKEGFYELLNNIMMVIDENKNYIFNAQMRMTSSNSDRSIKVNKSKPDLFQAPVQYQSNSLIIKDLDLIKNKNLHLKEMIEFLTKNLMMFLEELEELKLETKTFSNNQQMDELVQENEFLYQKLNEGHREIESLKKIIADINEKYPDTTKFSNLLPRRSVSMPAFSQEILDHSNTYERSSWGNFQERIKELIKFKNNGYKDEYLEGGKEKILNFDLDSHTQRKKPNTTGRAFFSDDKAQQFGPDPPQQDENNQESNGTAELENYNLFLINIIRQIKLIIDDVASDYGVRLNRLEEISKDLDIM